MIGTTERQYRKIASLKDGLRREKETSRYSARQLKKIKKFLQKQNESVKYQWSKWEMDYKTRELAKQENLPCSFISETYLNHQNGYLNGKEELLKELAELLKEEE